MNKRQRKAAELRAHLERWVDRARWPDYVLTDADMAAYVAHESTGMGEKPAPLAWVKKTEEITINQLWSEMAEMWGAGYGWSYPLHHTMRMEWSERRCSNIWMRKLLTIARSIRSKGFMDAMLAYTGFSNEDRAKYLDRRIAA